jgi:hypothetical protein
VIRSKVKILLGYMQYDRAGLACERLRGLAVASIEQLANGGNAGTFAFRQLTRMRVPSARGGGAEWSAQQVSNILKRTT